MTDQHSETRHQVISIVIKAPDHKIYDYVRNPMMLSKWAQGLSQADIRPLADGIFEAESPMGNVKIQFAPENTFGIMDHKVMLPNGEENHNYFRVIPAGDDSIVMFNLIQHKKMTLQEFQNDAQQIEADLQQLKRILET